MKAKATALQQAVVLLKSALLIEHMDQNFLSYGCQISPISLQIDKNTKNSHFINQAPDSK